MGNTVRINLLYSGWSELDFAASNQLLWNCDSTIAAYVFEHTEKVPLEEIKAGHTSASVVSGCVTPKQEKAK